jgi:outer membrane murein-binding lipoprotein Lpp
MRYFAAIALVSASLWVAGCQDQSQLDSKIAAQNAKIAQLEAEISEKGGPAKEGKDLSGDVAALRARLEKLESDKLDLAKKLSAQEEKLAAANKTIEGLGGEVSAGSADLESQVNAIIAKREEKRREEEKAKRDADREARQKQMQEWIAKAKEAGIDIDPNDPMGSGFRAWQDPVQREKIQKLMVSEFRKQRNERMKLDEATAQKLDVIEDETMKKMTDIQQRRRDGTITREQAQQETQAALSAQDQQVKNTLTEDQYKQYKETVGGMAGGMGGMGGFGGMIPGFGGEGGGGGRGR